MPLSIRARIGALRKTWRLLNDSDWRKSYHTNGRSKSKKLVFADHLIWALRKAEPLDYYFLGGFDRLNIKLPFDLPTNRQLMDRHRQLIRSRGAEKQATLIQDKVDFGDFLERNGTATPSVLALVTEGLVVRKSDGKAASVVDVADILPAGNYIFKPRNERGGTGIFSFEIKDGLVTEGQQSLRKLISGAGLIQERVRQHIVLETLNPTSLNTMRLVTVDEGGVFSPLAAFLRVGRTLSLVDNWQRGGIILPVDIESGRLSRRGYFKQGYGTVVHDHPDSGASFTGLELPDFSRAIRMACECHSKLSPLVSVGWDIAFSTGGPMVIEGNTLWGGTFFSAVEPDVIRRYMEIMS